MVDVVRINKNELSKIVIDIYDNDFENVSKIHKLNVDKSLTNVEKIVAYAIDTMASIDENEVICKLETEGKVVGFFTLSNKYNITQLNGFHIDKANRTKKVLKAFWDSIENSSLPKLICGLYEENKQAINHLKKNGFQEQEYLYVDKYEKNFLILNKTR
jgi:RimJ/RimL family protein N-acetyltransferase